MRLVHGGSELVWIMAPGPETRSGNRDRFAGALLVYITAGIIWQFVVDVCAIAELPTCMDPVFFEPLRREHTLTATEVAGTFGLYQRKRRALRRAPLASEGGARWV